jgi:hypothetical protein
MLAAAMLDVIILGLIIQSTVALLSIVILSIVMLGVLAPKKHFLPKEKEVLKLFSSNLFFPSNRTIKQGILIEREESVQLTSLHQLV